VEQRHGKGKQQEGRKGPRPAEPSATEHLAECDAGHHRRERGHHRGPDQREDRERLGGAALALAAVVHRPRRARRHGPAGRDLVEREVSAELIEQVAPRREA
jgi:hypothetical protein